MFWNDCIFGEKRMYKDLIEKFDDQIIIYHKRPSLWMLFLGLIMSALAVFCFYTMVTTGESLAMHILAGAGIVLFGGAFVLFFVRRFSKKKVLVTLDSQGLYFPGKEPFFWSEIDQIRYVVINHQHSTSKFIQFFVTDFEQRYSQMPFWEGLMRYANSKFTQSPRICAAEIAMQNVPCSKDEFLQILRSYSKNQILE